MANNDSSETSSISMEYLEEEVANFPLPSVSYTQAPSVRTPLINTDQSSETSSIDMNDLQERVANFPLPTASFDQLSFRSRIINTITNRLKNNYRIILQSIELNRHKNILKTIAIGCGGCGSILLISYLFYHKYLNPDVGYQEHTTPDVVYQQHAIPDLVYQKYVSREMVIPSFDQIIGYLQRGELNPDLINEWQKDGFNVNIVNNKNTTLPMASVYYGDYDSFQAFINAGADIASVNNDGYSADDIVRCQSWCFSPEISPASSVEQCGYMCPSICQKAVDLLKFVSKKMVALPRFPNLLPIRTRNGTAIANSEVINRGLFNFYRENDAVFQKYNIFTNCTIAKSLF